jgi:predicted RNA-binding Zn ribbon-like protein
VKGNWESIESLSLIGGIACLDFTNLVSWRQSSEPKDSMASYADLVHWSVRAGVLTLAEGDALRARSEREPSEAARVLATAFDLREALFRIFSAAAGGRGVASEDLGTLNRHLSRGLGTARLASDGVRFRLRFGNGDALDRMLPPIAWSAAELLLGPGLARVKECAGERCTWLFLDKSKNGSRKWCEMSDCGNRAKARRHYRRLKDRG